jgi:hypothetical protein
VGKCQPTYTTQAGKTPQFTNPADFGGKAIHLITFLAESNLVWTLASGKTTSESGRVVSKASDKRSQDATIDIGKRRKDESDVLRPSPCQRLSPVLPTTDMPTAIPIVMRVCVRAFLRLNRRHAYCYGYHLAYLLPSVLPAFHSS